METEKFVLSEIEKGSRQISVPETTSGRYIINKLLANRLIKDNLQEISIQDDRLIQNHYSITDKGRLWLSRQSDLV
jgi:DNA-binding PadR family transcriptional regulator